ncbi:MAG: SH3 domain-containing protein [Anaerolineae bacterium]|nr:SH3 domain-containing protein [Anaerolineae bacterium]
MSQQVVLTPSTALNVRQGPGIEFSVIDIVYPDDHLALSRDFQRPLGQNGDWVKVRTPHGIEGWSATWYISLALRAAESALRLTSTAHLNVRQGPGAGFPVIDLVRPGDDLALREADAIQLGRSGEWVAVRTPDGAEGWTAAWYVTAKLSSQALTPTVPLKVRAGAGREYAHLTTVVPGMRLTPLDPGAMDKAGKPDEWVRLRTPERIDGWSAAWYLRPTDPYPLLSVPWVSQIDRDSTGAFDCGQASLLMVLKFHDKVDVGVTVDDLNKIVPKYTSATQLRELAAHYTLTLKALYTDSVDRLRAVIDKGRPAIVLVDYVKLEFPDHLLSGPDQGWHWLVVTGYKDDGTFIVHDPLWLPYQRGGRGGAYLTIERDTLQNALLWQGIEENVVY